jgi:hypothetical protein
MTCRGGRNGDFAQVALFRYKGEYGKGTKDVYEGNGCLRYRIQVELDGSELAARCDRDETKCAECLEDYSGVVDEVSRLSFLEMDPPETGDRVLERGMFTTLGVTKIICKIEEQIVLKEWKSGKF